MSTRDLIEITASNIIQIRMVKTVTGGGGPVAMGYHRTSIQPGDNPDTIFAAVNAHLASMGVDQIAPSEWDLVKSTVAMVHTPAVTTAYKAQQTAQAAALGLKGVTVAPV